MNLFPRNASRRQRLAISEAMFRMQRRDHRLRRDVPQCVAYALFVVLLCVVFALTCWGACNF